jgi:hypothetical protein
MTFPLIFVFMKMVNKELELGKGILAQKYHCHSAI